MAIIDDIRALNKDPNSPNDVAEAIRLVAADPAGRMSLIQEWEVATGRRLPDPLRNDLTADAAQPTRGAPPAAAAPPPAGPAAAPEEPSSPS